MNNPGLTPINALLEGIRIALEALRANWLRAILAVLGIAIGVGVVVTVAAVITGIKSEVMQAFDSGNPEAFIVMPFDFTQVRLSGNDSDWWDRPDVSREEIRRLKSLPGVGEALPGFNFNASARYESEWLDRFAWSASDAGWPAYTQGDFTAGRDFTRAEVDQARAVVVVSSKLAEALFDRSDPIGKRIRVNAGRRAANETFTVIGVFEPVENLFGQANQHFAVTPYTAAEKRLKARSRSDFMFVQVVPREGVSGEEVEDQVTSALRSMRGLGPAEENNFALIKSEQMVNMFNQFTGVFFLVMIALSSVGMLVGGIGVVGIMLISVTERTREIGVRKALGATRREILWQFLIEASILTCIGGTAGLTLGWGLSSLVATISPLPSRIPLWSVFAAILLAIVTGILFGLLPAVRASKLDPVDALRYE